MPVAPDESVLPDPVSFRRLSFNPDGTGLILDSPERAWFEKPYEFLNGADLSRVRDCASCKRLFWARRRDQVACSKLCANRGKQSDVLLPAREDGQVMKRRVSEADRQKLIAEIGRLGALNNTELKARWKAVYGTEAPARMKPDLLDAR
jgi:hypothetical protein